MKHPPPAAARHEGFRPGNSATGQPEMAKFNPFQFLQEVRSEGNKVTWPTRKETLITTAMVFVLAIVAAIFFTLVDMIIRWGVGIVLGIGR
jgi:preprotein translocase subunit SecE